MTNYDPFLKAQILEDQDRSLIQDGCITNYSDVSSSELNQLLWGDIQHVVPNTLKIFEIGQKVYLVYFWLSNLREPRSNRGGMYLLVGMSCSKKEFKRDKSKLAHQFQHFLRTIINYSNTVNLNESTEVLSKLWELERMNYGLNEVLDEILNEYKYSPNQEVLLPELRQFVEKTSNLFKPIYQTSSVTINLDHNFEKTNYTKKHRI